MTRAFTASVAIAACVVSARAASPDTQPGQASQQTRDAIAQGPTIGTAVIAGRVMSDDADSRPVRRAVVTLAAGGMQLPQTTVSGDDGEFLFAQLPPGNYTLVAQKAAYVASFYGAKRAGRGPGVPLALLDGQRLTGLIMKMLHGGVITGVVRNQGGQPVVGLDVQVLPLQLAAGQRQLVMPSAFTAQVAAAGGGGGTATTDDRGMYRVYGLAPGPYIIQSRSDSISTAEARRVTTAEVQWATQAAAQSLAASPGSAPAPLDPAPAPGQTINYAPVFYPGTTDAAGATTITLAPNEEHSGADFTTQLVPTAHISGTLIGVDGQPMPGGQITLRSSEADAFDMLSLLIGGGGSRTAQDGRFTLSDVAPGHYILTARAAPRAPGGRQAPDSFLSQMPPQLLAMFGGQTGPAAQMLWAMTDLGVDGHDISDVTLTLQAGMSVSGKVVFEGAAPPADLTKVRVSLNTLPTSSSPVALAASMMLGGMSVSPAADGTFEMKGVLPDRYRIGAAPAGMFFGGTAAPTGWVLKSATLGARDASDVPFEVKPNQDVKDLVVTFTNQPTELSGMVIDQAGRAAPGFPIVVFSTDRAYWTIGSRRVQQARPSSDGNYKLTGLPAGEYYVSAVTDLEPNDLADPVFLEQLAAASFKITLADGEKKTTDLKLAGGGA